MDSDCCGERQRQWAEARPPGHRGGACHTQPTLLAAARLHRGQNKENRREGLSWEPARRHRSTHLEGHCCHQSAICSVPNPARPHSSTVGLCCQKAGAANYCRVRESAHTPYAGAYSRHGRCCGAGGQKGANFKPLLQWALSGGAACLDWCCVPLTSRFDCRSSLICHSTGQGLLALMIPCRGTSNPP